VHEFGTKVSELLEERGMDVEVLADIIRQRTGDETLTRAALAGMLEDDRQFGHMEIPTTFVSIVEILGLSDEQAEELQKVGHDVVRRSMGERRLLTERRSMDEPQETLTHLIECVVVSPEEARLLMEDEDLWLTLPSMRWTSTDPEEAVREWEKAYHTLQNAASVVAWGSEAAWSAIQDASERCLIAAERARERAAGEASA
jgi:exonuclease V gamma subunit